MYDITFWKEELVREMKAMETETDNLQVQITPGACHTPCSFLTLTHTSMLSMFIALMHSHTPSAESTQSRFIDMN